MSMASKPGGGAGGSRASDEDTKTAVKVGMYYTPPPSGATACASPGHLQLTQGSLFFFFNFYSSCSCPPLSESRRSGL